MGTPRIDHARALQTAIIDLLELAGLPDVEVSLNPLDIPSGARHGIVVIAPPDLEFPTHSITETTHELAIVAGPADNVPAAWATLDAIIEALRPLGLQAARADMFAIKVGAPLPGYIVTLHPDTLID